MKKAIFFTSIVLFFVCNSNAQTRSGDISISGLPDQVKAVLEEYVSILRSSNDLDECAQNVISVLGGSLVNDDATDLRNSVKPYSLKKDFNNVRWYADPIKITRVNLSFTNGDGYGDSAIKGKKYKIWIDKADKKNGMPAPISIVVPEEHPTIQKPKIVGIGSL
jgi:hypothetical protein